MPLGVLLRFVCHYKYVLDILNCAIIDEFRRGRPIALRGDTIQNVDIESDDEATQMGAEGLVVGVGRAENEVDIDRLI